MRREEQEDDRNGGRERKKGEKEILFMKCLLSFFAKSDITQWVDYSLLMRDDLCRQRMNILVP